MRTSSSPMHTKLGEIHLFHFVPYLATSRCMARPLTNPKRCKPPLAAVCIVFEKIPTNKRQPRITGHRVTVHALGTVSRNAGGVSRHPAHEYTPTCHLVENDANHRLRRFASFSQRYQQLTWAQHALSPQHAARPIYAPLLRSFLNV